MCLILLANRVVPAFPLVLAANRDEFYDRPTSALAAWPDDPDVFGGRDLRAGGTWFGVTRRGRWSAVTNVREPNSHRSGAPSRGELPRHYLLGDAGPRDYATGVAQVSERYNGFNLLVGSDSEIQYVSNRGRARGPLPLSAGIYGLSNADLDAPWPKVQRGKQALADRLADADSSDAEDLARDLLDLLADRYAAPESELPDTGIGLDWERRLSPICIVSERYGTRCSTILLRAADGRITIVERSLRPASDPPAVAEERVCSLAGR